MTNVLLEAIERARQVETMKCAMYQVIKTTHGGSVTVSLADMDADSDMAGIQMDFDEESNTVVLSCVTKTQLDALDEKNSLGVPVN